MIGRVTAKAMAVVAVGVREVVRARPGGTVDSGE